MASINKVILIGNIGTLDIKPTRTGGKLANMSVATSESWKDDQGQTQERTEWHKVVVYGKLAEIVEQYYSKGNRVYVEGKLQTRSWEGEDGQKRYVTEVVVSGFGGIIQNYSPKETASATQNPRYAPESMPEVKVAENTGFADDIPF